MAIFTVTGATGDTEVAWVRVGLATIPVLVLVILAFMTRGDPAPAAFHNAMLHAFEIAFGVLMGFIGGEAVGVATARAATATTE